MVGIDSFTWSGRSSNSWTSAAVAGDPSTTQPTEHPRATSQDQRRLQGYRATGIQGYRTTGLQGKTSAGTSAMMLRVVGLAAALLPTIEAQCVRQFRQLRPICLV